MNYANFLGRHKTEPHNLTCRTIMCLLRRRYLNVAVHSTFLLSDTFIAIKFLPVVEKLHSYYQHILKLHDSGLTKLFAFSQPFSYE